MNFSVTRKKIRNHEHILENLDDKRLCVCVCSIVIISLVVMVLFIHTGPAKEKSGGGSSFRVRVPGGDRLFSLNYKNSFVAVKVFKHYLRQCYWIHNNSVLCKSFSVLLLSKQMTVNQILEKVIPLVRWCLENLVEKLIDKL